MAQYLYGMVVNVSLLEKEGLSVPTNYSEFSQALTALKDKGYTPIQGSVDHLYSEIIYSMADAVIGSDQELQALIDNGLTDYAVNETYPADNYDQAILRFFEGDVPFWVCDTEKASGMKKRESKSEAFTASQFEYQFVFVPFGDNGVYEYREPWSGFSVNKDAPDFDYAVEFIRFLATEPELNRIAEIKGVPLATKTPSAGVYSGVANVTNAELSYTNSGAVKPHIQSYLAKCAKALAAGEISSAGEAAEQFVQDCSTVSRED